MSAGIGPFYTVRKYTSFAADIDLTAVIGALPNARAIYVKTAGTGRVDVVFADGTEVSFTGLSDGEYLEPSPAQYVTIKDTTDVTELWVGF